MTDEEFDDALDGMSPSKRRKILRIVGDDERAPPKKEKADYNILTVLFAMLFGMPLVAIGMALVVTVVAAPLGFVIMFLGAYPFVRVVRSSVNRHTYKKFNS